MLSTLRLRKFIRVSALQVQYKTVCLIAILILLVIVLWLCFVTYVCIRSTYYLSVHVYRRVDHYITLAVGR